ncbi:MAG TPA: 3D domain-containing protein [Pyrinomonadaceae bacterium]|nr:3D domain-containing protein [Pyrinomonadaceae bacterium]
MLKSLFGGGAVLTAALLLCSLTFYSPTLFAENRPDGDDSPTETTTSTLINASQESGTLSGSLMAAFPVAALAGTSKAAAEPASPNAKAEDASAGLEPAQRFTATAYALPGRTASGHSVRRGLIAADKSLPLGTRVRLDAGHYSGEYLVADRGSRVRGRTIDIWVPSNGEAIRFGRRPVKLTILSYGAKKTAKRAAKTRL